MSKRERPIRAYSRTEEQVLQAAGEMRRSLLEASLPDAVNHTERFKVLAHFASRRPGLSPVRRASRKAGSIRGCGLPPPAAKKGVHVVGVARENSGEVLKMVEVGGACFISVWPSLRHLKAGTPRRLCPTGEGCTGCAEATGISGRSDTVTRPILTMSSGTDQVRFNTTLRSAPNAFQYVSDQARFETVPQREGIPYASTDGATNAARFTEEA